MSIRVLPRQGEMPPPRQLLPTELVLCLGCVGCSSRPAGLFTATGTREERREFWQQVLEVGELTGLPVKIENNSAMVSVGSPDEANCADHAACRDPDTVALLRDTGLRI